MPGSRPRASAAAPTPTRARVRAPVAGDPPADGGDAVAAAGRLHAVAIHLLRRLRREDAASGLTAPRLSALSVLVFGGPMPLGALAAAEQVRPPTMTRLVAALERLGLVARATDAADGRVVVLRATARGRRLLEEGRARRVGVLAEGVAALPAAERAALERALPVIEALAAGPGPDGRSGPLARLARSSHGDAPS